MTKLLIISLVAFSSFQTFAENMDNYESRKALHEAQQVLINKDERAKVIETDKSAKDADDFVKKVTGGDSQGMYNMSAEILEIFYNQSAGDPKKMEELVLKASRDPAAFYKSLPQHLQQQISKTAENSPLNKKTKP